MSGIANPTVIVLFCILGAGACVVLGYATTRQFGGHSDDDDANLFRKRRDDQIAYMRQVRMQNIAWAEMEARAPRGSGGYAASKGLTATIEPRYENPSADAGVEHNLSPTAAQKGKQMGAI